MEIAIGRLPSWCFNIAREYYFDLSLSYESNRVLCVLQREVQHLGLDEVYERILLSMRGYRALHDEILCRQDLPCVIICTECNSRNIASILVHESIHHALLWLNDEPFEEVDKFDDKFDEISDEISRRGFKI